MAVVLVINDDRDLLDTYREVIGEMGHRAVTELAAESGPQTIRQSGAHALVVDLQRPDETDYGLRIVEEVRADSELAAIPIVVCTGASESHLRPLRRRLTALGVPILPKPFTLREFEAALDRLLGGTATSG